MNKTDIIEMIIINFKPEKIMSHILQIRNNKIDVLDFNRWCIRRNTTMIKRNYSKQELILILKILNPDLYKTLNTFFRS